MAQSSTIPSLAPQVQEFVSTPRRMLIDSAWVKAASGKTFPVYDPATEEIVAHVAEGEAANIDRAVRATRQAFDIGPWRKVTPSERGRMLWRLGDLLESHAEEFAHLESLDNGKPLKIARMADVPMAADMFRYMAGWATKIEGNTIPISAVPAPQVNFLAYTRHEPLGVVGQIIPWNFPLLMAAWKLALAPALAGGCTVVLKPAEQTPLTALRLGELILEAGFPNGVVNIVPGYGETPGGALAAHPDVDKVAFTGSTEGGRLIVQAAAGNLKKVSLELRGKSLNIVFSDSDLNTAIPSAANAIFFNHGQCCCAGSRLYVQKDIFADGATGVFEAAKKIRIGPGFDPHSTMGPIVSREQLERVCGYTDAGFGEGAKALVGGKLYGDRGYFFEPTVLVDTQPTMKVVQDEIFGPVVTAMPFDDLDDLVRVANDTVYGLAAGIWTRDISKVHRMAEALQAGTVWINCYNVFDAALPFGGYKQSGWDREMGHHALELYTEVRSVVVGL